MSAAETPGSSLIRAAVFGTVEAAHGLTIRLAPEAAAIGSPRLRDRHVLIIGLDYAPACTPIAPYTTAIAEHLATLVGTVTVLAGLPELPDGRVPAPYRRGLRFAGPGWLNPDAPRVIRLRHAWADRVRPGRPASPDPGFFVAALLAGRTLEPDLIVAITPSAGGAAAAARLATRRAVPLVTIVQAMTQPGAEPSRGRGRRCGRDAPRPVAPVAGRLERYALRRSNEVAVTSPAFCEVALAAGVAPERLHLMPNWSPLRPATESRAEARQALGWPPGRFAVVHAGPMGYGQDLATVVEAARIIAARREIPAAPVDVVLVGDGTQRPALEQQAFGLPNVRFLEAADDDVAALALSAADVLLIAESGSGSTTVAGQLSGYLSAGRPVLAAASDAAAVAHDLRRAGDAGVRVDSGRPTALAEAILALRAAPERRRAMGRNALRYARSQLGRDASLRRLELVIDAALTGRDR